MMDTSYLLYEEYLPPSTGATTPPCQWTTCWLETWSPHAGCFMTRWGWWTFRHTNNTSCRPSHAPAPCSRVWPAPPPSLTTLSPTGKMLDLRQVFLLLV